MQQIENYRPFESGHPLRCGGAHAEEAGRQLHEHVQRAKAAEEVTQEAQREAAELRQQVSHHTQHSQPQPGWVSSKIPHARLCSLLISTRSRSPDLQVVSFQIVNARDQWGCIRAGQ